MSSPAPDDTAPTKERAAMLPGALSFVITAATVAVIAGIELSWGIAAGLALVSVLALIAGLRGRVRPVTPMLGGYVLVIVAKLVADSARYGFGFTDPRGAEDAGSGAPFTGVIWFVRLVVAPVCLMLLGGYLIGRGYPVGSILIWWTPLLAAADGLWTLALVQRLDWDRPGPAAAVAVAALVETLAATWAVQRLLRPAVAVDRPEPAGLTARQRNLWTALLAALVVVYAATVWNQAGLLPVGVIGGSMMGGLIGWRKTTSRAPADPAFHVPLFLLLLAMFYLHVGEESLTGFNRAIADISGTPWSEGPFTVLIGLLGPVVWVFGAWSLWKRQPIGNFILWFMIVAMILGEPVHLLLFPVITLAKDGGGYQYFSGMYTALFPLIPAIIALAHIVRTHRGRDSLGSPLSQASA